MAENKKVKKEESGEEEDMERERRQGKEIECKEEKKV